MALETLDVQSLNRDGTLVDLQSITTAGGFRFLNDGKTLLYMENDAGNMVLTFAIQEMVDGEAVTVKTITVTASENWVMGPFPQEWYNDANGMIIVTCDADLATATAPISMF